MSILDVFNSDAFSVVTLTDAINKVKFVPGRIGQLGLFQETPVATTSVALEEKDGVISLVSPTPRGGPGQTLTKNLRAARVLRVPHFEINDGIMAEEVQGVRAFGSETELETVQGKVAERMEYHQQSHSATQEYSRIGAIKGTVTYADGSALDLFSEFGVSANASVALNLPSATDGALSESLADVAKTITDSLGGLPYRGLMSFCGANFWKKLRGNAEVRATFLNQPEAAMLRAGLIDATGLSYGTFEFGGVVWEAYRGAVGATTFVGADDAWVFPVGVPGLFRSYYAPADYIETVNTLGRRVYAKQYPMENGKGVSFDTQMNTLEICTRPTALVHCTTGT